MKLSSRLSWMACGAVLALAVIAAVRWIEAAGTTEAGRSRSPAAATGEPRADAERGILTDKSPNGDEADSFASRLAAALATANEQERDRQLSSVLVDWIRVDFPAAFDWLAARGFEDLTRLPMIAQLVANRVTTDDLASIAENAAEPFAALNALAAQNVSAELRSDLIQLMRPRVDRADPAQVAAFTSLLTSQNLDAGLRYAGDLESQAVQGPAYAAVIDQLRLQGSTTEAREIFEALPGELRAHDHVLFAHGLAMRDIDPGAAIESLAQIQDAQFRKLALVKFARDVESVSPGAAIQAIASSGLTGEGIANHAGRIVSTWARHDPVAARSFLDDATCLPEPERAALLGVIDETRIP